MYVYEQPCFRPSLANVPAQPCTQAASPWRGARPARDEVGRESLYTSWERRLFIPGLDQPYLGKPRGPK